jgi:hypothetical protein
MELYSPSSHYFSVVLSCPGCLGYPFKNTRGKSNVEKLARYVDKEETTWVKLSVSANVLERISQAASTIRCALAKYL